MSSNDELQLLFFVNEWSTSSLDREKLDEINAYSQQRRLLNLLLHHLELVSSRPGWAVGLVRVGSVGQSDWLWPECQNSPTDDPNGLACPGTERPVRLGDQSAWMTSLPKHPRIGVSFPVLNWHCGMPTQIA